MLELAFPFPVIRHSGRHVEARRGARSARPAAQLRLAVVRHRYQHGVATGDCSGSCSGEFKLLIENKIIGSRKRWKIIFVVLQLLQKLIIKRGPIRMEK